MIKNWQKFNENGLFTDSEVYKQIGDKYKIPKEQISQYFFDAIDDNKLSINIQQFVIRSNKNEITNKIYLIVEKTYKNPINKEDNLKEKDEMSGSVRYTKSLIGYENLIKEHLDDISKLRQACNRFSEEEEAIIDGFNFVIPLNITTERRIENLHIRLEVKSHITINTNEMDKAMIEFEKIPNVVNTGYKKLIGILVKEGIPEKDAIVLVDKAPIQTDRITQFGFNTNDEVLIIADVDVKSGELELLDEFDMAIELYKKGECSDFL